MEADRHAVGRTQRTLIGVFRETRDAEAVRSELVAAGVDRTAIRIGDESDRMTSLKGEMREELSRAAPGIGAAGPATKEMAVGIARAAVVGGAIGAVLGLVLALVFLTGVDWWARVLIGIAIGALAGGVVGTVVGGSLAPRGPADPMGAQRGVTVAVTADEERARPVLLAHDPIRVDVVEAGVPRDVVATEDDHSAEGLAEHLDRDDYRRDEPPR